MKPQAALILCEWDKHNILRELPSSTWMGENWDNSHRVGPWFEEAAQIVRDGRDYLELTLHGIGHEYWQASARGESEFTRAEWHDRSGTMRPRDEVLARLEYFEKLLNEHNLGAFPTSFVPCAFLHRFAAPHEDGLAQILKQHGINFISTPFRTMHGAEHVQHGLFGFDGGVMTADRGQDLQRWFSIGTPPEGELTGPICGMHWPNILHPDSQRNDEVVNAWVKFLRPYNERTDRMLAPDTATFATQLAHHKCTEYVTDGDGVSLDVSRFQTLPQSAFNQSLYLKILAPRSTPALLFTAHDAEIGEVQNTVTDSGTLYTLRLNFNSGSDRARVQWQRNLPFGHAAQ